MKRYFPTRSLALIVCLAVPVTGLARGPGTELCTRTPPPEHQIGDLFSVAAHGGWYWPVGELNDGKFRNDFASGGTLTFWLSGLVDRPIRGFTEHFGLRLGVLFASTEANGELPPQLDGAEPDVWHINGDLVLRWPILTTRGRAIPYLLGGLGVKRYEFDFGSETDFAGNLGFGFEWRIAADRIGFGTEFRTFMSNFDRFDIDENQYDLTWTGFISFSL